MHVSEPRPGRRVLLPVFALIATSSFVTLYFDLRREDGPDLLTPAIALTLCFFMYRRSRWARWTTAVLYCISGVLGLGLAVVIALLPALPGYWTPMDPSIPALATMSGTPGGRTLAQALPITVVSWALPAILDLSAAALLFFGPFIRSYFSREQQPDSA